MRALSGLLVVAVLVDIAACVGDDPTITGPSAGERGGPCNAGRCLEGLSCVDDVCVAIDRDAASPQDGSTTTGGDAHTDCTPSSSPPFEPTWKLEEPKQADQCNQAERDNITVQCSDPNSSNCKAALATESNCAHCMTSNADESQWSAIIANENGVRKLNRAACIEHTLALHAGNCGVPEMNRRDCVDASCASCATIDRAACESAAMVGRCRNYAATADCASAMTASGPSLDACFGNDGREILTKIAPFFCSVR
jgi:hypothetical protein